ncbi:MAG: S-layer homology domain-containing protein [Leptolyngbyaceae cyanobacterium SM2_5_2]|nr:S-layer homology domain-containing protein [Leptolyngbyaceae cyanobacterium SM2_5_2]
MLPPLSAPAPRFTDVSLDHWIYPQLTDLAARQLVAGFPDGSFRPAATMTRAELATQLVRVFDLVNHVPASQYPDVPPSHWAGDSISRALQMRFLTGFPDQTFRPDQNATRLEVIMALANGLSLRSSRPPQTALQVYQDAQQIPDWAKVPLVAALDAGLMAIDPEATKLDPQRLASRAEVIALVHQALVYTGSLRALPPPSTTRSVSAEPPASRAN